MLGKQILHYKILEELGRGGNLSRTTNAMETKR